MTTKLRVTRRELLTGVGATVGLSAFGCSSSDETSAGATGTGGTSTGGATAATGGAGTGTGGAESGGSNTSTGGATGSGGASAGTTGTGGGAATGGADGGFVPPQGMPQYMQGMADFEVRTLTNVTGPFATMYDSLPAEWKQTGQPNGANYVFGAWSGGAEDIAHMRMFVHGGGHNDSSNNGLYVYDFSGDTAPVGWSVAPNSLSALSAVTPSVNTYSDGKPAGIHSYNQLVYEPSRNRFYRFGGSGFGPGGGGITGCFYYDFSASAWSTFLTDSRVGTTLGSSLLASPDGTTLLYLASNKEPLFVAASDAAVTAFGDAMTGSEESGFVFAMDTKRSNTATGVCKYVAFYHDAAGPRAMVVTVDWSAKTFTKTTQTLTGADAGDLESAGPCVLYDPQRDSFWVFANATDFDDGTIPSIYEVDATTFAVTKNALKTPIASVQGGRGGYNRHIWFSDWRIIGTVHAHDQPVSIIKVP